PEAAAWSSATEYLLHRLALRELVDQLVEIADLLHQRVLDLLDADPADDTLDQAAVRVDPGSGEELLERRAGGKAPRQLSLVVPGQPADHLVQLSLRPSLPLHLRQVVRIDRRDARGEDPVHLPEPSRARQFPRPGGETHA